MDESEWRKTLLETPSGFALFDVDENALKETDDIWMYFMDVAAAKKVMFHIGFVQFADKSVAWDGETQPSKDLIRLIRKSCKGTKDLFVQSVELQAVIKEKLNVKCSYKDSVVDELIWGMKNVLHGFIFQEINNINREYCLPLSKGLQQFLQYHLINVSPEMRPSYIRIIDAYRYLILFYAFQLDRDFISEIGLLRYVDTTLEQVPKTLRESFDEHVCRIGESIENNLDYARVLASILVPELAPRYDFFKMFSSDLAQKIQKADEFATQYRNEKLSMRDREIIMGALDHLLAVPKQRNEIMIRIKLMESKLRAQMMMLKGYRESIREPAHLEHSTYRRTLLETPSGFAIFDVKEVVFRRPKHIWTWFTSEMDAHEAVLALGFAKVQDKSIVRDSCHGPGQDLSRLIRTLCSHGTKLIVEDNDLKSVIEEKLKVKCFTKFSSDDDSLGDLMWGLKCVLHEFVPQEMENLNEDYYLPMSKGLQNALLSYGVSVPQGQMDGEFIYALGCLDQLDWTLSVVALMFRSTFDHLVSHIDRLIKDHVDYAKVTAHVLVPESPQKFDPKLLSSDLEEKVDEVAIKIKESGKSINEYDKQVILAVRGYLSDLYEKKDRCLQFLKGKDSEELPRIAGPYDDIVNSWLMSVTKSSQQKRLIVDDEGKCNIEAIKAPQKATRETRITFPEADNTSNKGADNVKSQQQPYSISEAADHLASSKGADNANQQHYPSTATFALGQCDIEEVKAPQKITRETRITSPETDNTSNKGADNFNPQQQPCSTSEAADHLASSEGADNAYQQHYPSTGDAENMEQNADNTNCTTGSASDEEDTTSKATSTGQSEGIKVANGTTNSTTGSASDEEDTTSKATSTDQSEGIKVANGTTNGTTGSASDEEDTTSEANIDQSDDKIKKTNGTSNVVSGNGTKGAGKNEVTGDQGAGRGGRGRITLQALLDEENNDTKRKEGIKNWLGSFRRRSSSKDNLPVSLGSAGSARWLLPSKDQSKNASVSSSKAVWRFP